MKNDDIEHDSAKVVIPRPKSEDQSYEDRYLDVPFEELEKDPFIPMLTWSKFGLKYCPELRKLLLQVPVKEMTSEQINHAEFLIRQIPVALDTAAKDIMECVLPGIKQNLLAELGSFCLILSDKKMTTHSDFLDFALHQIQGSVAEVMRFVLDIDKNEISLKQSIHQRRPKPPLTFSDLFAKGFNSDTKIAALKKILLDHKFITSQNQWIGLKKTKNELSTIIHYLKDSGVISLTVTPTILKVFYAEFGLELSLGDRKRSGDYANVKSLGKDNIDNRTWKKAQEIFRDYLSKK